MPLVDRPEILALLGHLLGYNIQFGNSHAFIRPGFKPGTDPLHQALFKWHCGLMFTAALCQTGVTPAWPPASANFFITADAPIMASLYIVPGSHRSSGRPARDRSTDQPFGKFELLAEAGSAVLFDYRLCHSTAPNYSPAARKNLTSGTASGGCGHSTTTSRTKPLCAAASPVMKQLLGYDLSDIEDGYIGYQEPRAVGTRP